MLLSKEVEVIITASNLEKYKNLGYEINTKIYRNRIVVPKNTKCIIKIEDLDRKSSAKILYRCDYCGVEKEVCYKDYMKHYPDGLIKEKDACLKCANKKTSEILNNKYGVLNCMELNDVKEKIKQTNIDRYGVECTLNSKENREIIKNGFLAKYGVPYYSMTDECKEKVKNTNIDRFGAEYYSQTEEYIDSMKLNLNEKYGVDNVSKIEEVKIKKAQSFYKNGTVATSKQQMYLYNLLGGELNYSDNTPSLDIAFPNDKIYIEYNGAGHDLCVKINNMTQKEFDNREIARYYFMKKLGWKAIFINSPRDYLPTDEIILQEIDNAIAWFKLDLEGHSHYNINVGGYINDVKYGKLRKIKE